MEKYNKLLRNIAELIEKGLFTSKDLKKEVENSLKFKMEIIANKLNLVSREEFEVQKKIIKKTAKNKYNFASIKTSQFDDIIVYLVLGIILGGRLGYVMLYILDITAKIF